MTHATATIPRFDDDPFGDEILTEPYEFHRRLRDAAPVVYLTRYDVHACGRYGDVRAVLTNWQDFTSSRGVGHADFAREKPWRSPSLLLETDPPFHTDMRTVMNDVISVRSVRNLREPFTRAAEELVEELVRRGSFDVVSDLAEIYPLRVFPDALGMGEDGRENLLPLGALAFNAFGPDNALRRRALADAAPVQEWVARACRRSALAPGGFGARIWEAADRGVVTGEQAALLVRSLLLAGVDTTVYGITNALHALASHPEQWQRLHEDPSLVKFAFDEALRWESPVQTFFRTTTGSVDVAGTTIPDGAKVLLFLGSANRDPRHWGDDADAFDIGRRAAGHVAFGMGVHHCLGQPVARLEAEMVLTALARRVRSLELADEPTPKLNNTLKGWASVPVRVRAAS
jgi:cytochrome P450